MTQKLRFYHTDFATCLAACMVLLGKTAFPTSIEFHQKLAAAFEKHEAALDEVVTVTFHIRPHWLHGDSETIHDIIYVVSSRGLANFDFPRYKTLTFDMSADFAEEILAAYPMELRLIIEEIAKEVFDIIAVA